MRWKIYWGVNGRREECCEHDGLGQRKGKLKYVESTGGRVWGGKEGSQLKSQPPPWEFGKMVGNKEDGNGKKSLKKTPRVSLLEEHQA